MPHVVTGCKPPHNNVPALQRTHRPVRHLLISRAEAQTVDLLYVHTTDVQFSVVSFSRPCNIRFAGHATLVTFHNQGTYSGSEQFLTGPTIKRHRSTGKLSRVHFPFMQLRQQQQCQDPSIPHRLTTIICLITWTACGLWVIWRSDQQQVEPSSIKWQGGRAAGVIIGDRLLRGQSVISGDRRHAS